MKPIQRSSRERLLASCADFGPDDGIDPRETARQGGPPRRTRRKALQLCSQVDRALHAILAGCADDVLNGLAVVSVEPAPGARRLLVTVASAVPGTELNAAQALARLGQAAGMLRSEVA